jgi:hypothetical protein
MTAVVILTALAIVAMVGVMERIIRTQAKRLRLQDQEIAGLRTLVRQRDARIEDLMEAGIEQAQRLNLQSDVLRDLLADSK